MLTSEIKKGMRISLSHSASMGQFPRWQGTMMDNMSRGKTRFVDVEGFEHEMGSVYAFDIEFVEIDGRWIKVELTPNQVTFREQVKEQEKRLNEAARKAGY